MVGRLTSSLQSSAAVKCMKFILSLFNLIFLASGLAILVLGIWMLIELHLYMELTSIYQEQAPFVLVAVGGSIIFIGIFACLCTLKGHPCLLYTYSVILLFIFVIEMGAAIASFIYGSHLKEGFSQGLTLAMEEYSLDDDKKRAIDGMQKRLKCCGKNSFQDWYSTNWTGPDFVERVPKSCCIKKGCDQASTEGIYHEGCFKKLSDFMQGNFWLVGGLAIGFSFLQLIGALFSCCLAKNINKAKYEQVE